MLSKAIGFSKKGPAKESLSIEERILQWCQDTQFSCGPATFNQLDELVESAPDDISPGYLEFYSRFVSSEPPQFGHSKTRLPQPYAWVFNRPLRTHFVPSNLADSVEELKKEMSEIEVAIQEMRDAIIARPLVSSLSLSDIGESNLEVISPISIVLEETENEALARWPEIRASGLGGTAAEAIANLKSEVVDLYSDLVHRDPKDLGEIAVYTLGILNSHIKSKQ